MISKATQHREGQGKHQGHSWRVISGGLGAGLGGPCRRYEEEVRKRIGLRQTAPGSAGSWVQAGAVMTTYVICRSVKSRSFRALHAARHAPGSSLAHTPSVSVPLCATCPCLPLSYTPCCSSASTSAPMLCPRPCGPHGRPHRSSKASTYQMLPHHQGCL